MAGSTTFNKLQKERRRKEKQEEKAARRLERKREKTAAAEGGQSPDTEAPANDAASDHESVGR